MNLRSCHKILFTNQQIRCNDTARVRRNYTHDRRYLLIMLSKDLTAFIKSENKAMLNYTIFHTTNHDTAMSSSSQKLQDARASFRADI